MPSQGHTNKFSFPREGCDIGNYEASRTIRSGVRRGKATIQFLRRRHLGYCGNLISYEAQLPFTLAKLLVNMKPIGQSVQESFSPTSPYQLAPAAILDYVMLTQSTKPIRHSVED